MKTQKFSLTILFFFFTFMSFSQNNNFCHKDLFGTTTKISLLEAGIGKLIIEDRNGSVRTGNITWQISNNQYPNPEKLVIKLATGIVLTFDAIKLNQPYGEIDLLIDSKENQYMKCVNISDYDEDAYKKTESYKNWAQSWVKEYDENQRKISNFIDKNPIKNYFEKLTGIYVRNSKPNEIKNYISIKPSDDNSGIELSLLNNTTLYGVPNMKLDDIEAIAASVNYIKYQIEITTSGIESTTSNYTKAKLQDKLAKLAYDNEKLQERLAKLAGGVAEKISKDFTEISNIYISEQDINYSIRDEKINNEYKWTIIFSFTDKNGVKSSVYDEKEYKIEINSEDVENLSNIFIDIDNIRGFYKKTEIKDAVINKYVETKNSINLEGELPGFDTNVYDLIYSQINTELLKESGKQGWVIVTIIVNIDGSFEVKSFYTKTPWWELENEIERIVKLLPKVTPAVHNGKVVKFEFNTKINIDLSKK